MPQGQKIAQPAADRATTTIANTAHTSAAITLARNLGNPRGAVVEVPSQWTAADIGFDVCNTEAGTYIPLRYKDGTRVRISGIATAEANSYAAPAELFVGLTYNYVKLRSLTAGADTTVAQGADRNLAMQFAY